MKMHCIYCVKIPRLFEKQNHKDKFARFLRRRTYRKEELYNPITHHIFKK
jgi:hypothetical protein